MWIEDGALEDWQTCGQGGQARYTDAAIQTSLMLRTAFKLPLRQTEGLMASVLKLMGLTISAPDHTTVSRRAVKLNPEMPRVKIQSNPGSALGMNSMVSVKSFRGSVIEEIGAVTDFCVMKLGSVGGR